MLYATVEYNSNQYIRFQDSALYYTYAKNNLYLVRIDSSRNYFWSGINRALHVTCGIVVHQRVGRSLLRSAVYFVSLNGYIVS